MMTDRGGTGIEGSTLVITVNRQLENDRSLTVLKIEIYFVAPLVVEVSEELHE